MYFLVHAMKNRGINCRFICIRTFSNKLQWKNKYDTSHNLDLNFYSFKTHNTVLSVMCLNYRHNSININVFDTYIVQRMVM